MTLDFEENVIEIAEAQSGHTSEEAAEETAEDAETTETVAESESIDSELPAEQENCRMVCRL